MHFVTGELIDVRGEPGRREGRLRVGGAIVRVDLAVLPDAKPGEIVLAHAGVAISRLRLEGADVPGDTGESDLR